MELDASVSPRSAEEILAIENPGPAEFEEIKAMNEARAGSFKEPIESKFIFWAYKHSSAIIAWGKEKRRERKREREHRKLIGRES